MTENWDSDLQALANEYSPGYVLTAFRVRNKIAKHGYKGIHYTDKTESYLKQIGSPQIVLKVEKHMRKELRKTR